MRKSILCGLFFSLAGASTILAANHSVHIGAEPKSHEVNIAHHQVVTISELTSEMTEDFFNGKTPQVVLECTEGSTLPFNLSLKGEFLSIESDEISREIKVLKTCFIKRVDDTFLFSTDLQIWEVFQDFFTGMVGVSLGIEESIPTVSLNVELNQRT